MSTDKHYLEALSYRFPTISKASTEIINLSSILALPKATEHYLSDVHGEYEQFDHILRNCSGTIKEKIREEFNGELTEEERTELATLIYYPQEKMSLVAESGEDMDAWYHKQLYLLLRMIRRVSMKYSRSKVRRTIDPDYLFIIDEMLAVNDVHDKQGFYEQIMEAVIGTKTAADYIIAFSECIQKMAINHLHIVGDIYDRGPGPHIILDRLMGMNRDIDIQWGNHDIVWMGAALGNKACIATVLRLSARYGNLDIIEDGYGINLIPLMRFALSTYGDDDCECFQVKKDGEALDPAEIALDLKMHKALAIIQFKLEGQLIKRHPEYHMDDRLLLDKLDLENKTITIYGKTWPIEDAHLPTLDMADPYKLSDEEEALVGKLQEAFLRCEKLQKHTKFLLDCGSMYLIRNNNLLFHGSIPLNEDGSFAQVEIDGEKYYGRALMDKLDNMVRQAYYMSNGPEKEVAADIAYFLWTNATSPLFGKTKMTTFERYFIKDKESHKEPKSPYYKLYDNEEVVLKIFEEFGLSAEEGHIINGHVPVKQTKGESPIKCGGKLLIIDGGFSRAYHKTTGIAGYTLIANSYGLKLVYHEPFTSTEEAIRTGQDIHSETIVVEHVDKRLSVADTDNGKSIKRQVEELYDLIEAYRDGSVREKKVAKSAAAKK